MTKTFKTDFGVVVVNTAMFDVDGTTLEEGIEIKVPNVQYPIEIYGYHDIEEMTVKDVENLLEDNY